MAFIRTTFTSRYLPTNNQLRTSSNPGNQATIQDGRVTVQTVQERQNQGYASSGARSNSTATGGPIRHEVQGETMTTVNQGISVEEIERIVAQRVANAIEAIAIYETKTNMVRKSVIQTKRQEDKVAKNASNKRK
ncbi:hypothetical protein Tco_1107652 [Tanacetum coccineum]